MQGEILSGLARNAVAPPDLRNGRIAIEPLSARHELPPGFPAEYWHGNALVAVRGGRTIGICGAARQDDAAIVGMILTPELRRKPVFLHKLILDGLAGLKAMGVKKVIATADNETSRRWLKRLGFSQDGKGYTKCLE